MHYKYLIKLVFGMNNFKYVAGHWYEYYKVPNIPIILGIIYIIGEHAEIVYSSVPGVNLLSQYMYIVYLYTNLT